MFLSLVLLNSWGTYPNYYRRLPYKILGCAKKKNIGTYGHKDPVGIYFRGLGFALLCESSFRFSYRFSGPHKRSTHVVRIATHSVCFLVCLVAFVLASTLKALTA